MSNTSIPIILYLHGIFSNRALDHRIGLYKLLQKMNYHVITFDYRCFGDSDSADLSEIGCVEDSQYVLQWIMEKVKNNSTPIFVWGHSLGSGYKDSLIFLYNKVSFYLFFILISLD